MKFLNDAELESLLNLLDLHKGERDSILIRVLLFTGARTIEVTKLTKADLREGGLFIHAAKGSNDRLVPLAADFYEELKTYAANMAVTDRLFPIATRTIRHIWKHWRPNRNLGAHSLRHTIGVRHYSSCADIHATKTLLGHKSISSTLIYLDFVESQRKLRATMRGVFPKKKRVA
jgi:integrase